MNVAWRPVLLVLVVLLAGGLALFSQSPGYWSVGVWTGPTPPVTVVNPGQVWIDTSATPAIIKILRSTAPPVWAIAGLPSSSILMFPAPNCPTGFNPLAMAGAALAFAQSANIVFCQTRE